MEIRKSQEVIDVFSVDVCTLDTTLENNICLAI